MILLHTHTFSLSWASALDLLVDACLDALKALPFLFFAFLIIELLEHHAGEKLSRFFARSGKAGPAVGALLGCVPQCGFSVMSANLYAGGVITLGTLIAVFLSTSDEAVILLVAEPGRRLDIFQLLFTKVIIAVIAGYIVDFLGRRRAWKNPGKISDLCDHEHCGCHDHKGVFVPALIHTAKVFGFLLLFTVLLNFAVVLLGDERLSHILLSDSVFQPFLAALVGFIPNCAASVLLTQLYLEGAISFGSVIAGLCTGAGAGLLILFRENRHARDNLKIMGILYICAVIPGVLLQLLGI